MWCEVKNYDWIQEREGGGNYNTGRFLRYKTRTRGVVRIVNEESERRKVASARVFGRKCDYCSSDKPNPFNYVLFSESAWPTKWISQSAQLSLLLRMEYPIMTSGRRLFFAKCQIHIDRSENFCCAKKKQHATVVKFECVFNYEHYTTYLVVEKGKKEDVSRRRQEINLIKIQCLWALMIHQS